MLYAVGSIVFDTFPLNVDQVSRFTGGDFAEKPIMGRTPSFEHVGEAAEELRLGGKLLLRFGGQDEWDALHQLRREGRAQYVLRGDGRACGWFLIFSIREDDRFLDAKGRGQIVEFEIEMRRADRPPAAEYQGAQLGLTE